MSSNSTTIINTIFILFFVMSSFYSTNLKKTQKTLGSSSFDIFNIGKLAKDTQNYKKKLANDASEENVKKSLKEEFLKTEEESKEKNLKKHLKEELKKTKEQSSDESVKQQIKKEIAKTQNAAKSVKQTPKKSNDTILPEDLKRDEYELRGLARPSNKNLTRRNKKQKHQFLHSIMSFIQEEMQLTDSIEDPELKKIKSLINSKTNNHNHEDAELKKIKNLIKKHTNDPNYEDPETKKIKNLIKKHTSDPNYEDPELKKIKSLINPQMKKKAEKLSKDAPKAPKSTSAIQTGVRVENPLNALKAKIGNLNKDQIADAIKNVNKTEVIDSVQKMIKEIPKREVKAPATVELQREVREKSPVEIIKVIKGNFNKTMINKTMIKEAINKAVNKAVSKAKVEVNKTEELLPKRVSIRVSKIFKKTDEAVDKIANVKVQKFNKTLIKEVVHKTEQKLNKTKEAIREAIQQRFNKTEIKSEFKKINRTKINKAITKNKLKNNFKSHVEEKISEVRTAAEIREEETLNNHIKDFSAKSLLAASERLEKEITAELQKESAEDTAEQVKALLKFKTESYAEDFKIAATELKGEISADILNESEKAAIMEKAKAVKILEFAGKASIEEKEQTAATLKKIVFKMMKVKSEKETDYAKQVLARAYDKMNDLKNQEIEKNHAEEKYAQAIEVDVEEKEKTFDSLRNAKDEAKTAIEEIAEEKVEIEAEKKIQAREVKQVKKNLRGSK